MSKIRTYESNSQLMHRYDYMKNSCSWCQRYELMRAIHNDRDMNIELRKVVPDVKDTNLWEQFTTKPGAFHPSRGCSWCQRYELMRAIHNTEIRLTQAQKVVPDVKDTNLWEQFTTCIVIPANNILLFLMSKIRTYESNSQQLVPAVTRYKRCSWCQRYELMRAIHNFCGRRPFRSMVVPDVKDTNLWEQFTTLSQQFEPKQELFLMSKIRTYESNSQRWSLCWSLFSCCSWCQRYELMRAIHNSFLPKMDISQVVPDVKDTNLWEQFTTSSMERSKSTALFLMSKIRTYESNSQPGVLYRSYQLGCSWCQRYELMRAIHNPFA